ncbi:MAG: short-chain dehydrogenase [Hyphomicrobiales bacterium]|nr:MAG: short-chain dehydrogenase [Hyphomicrobiales bacterium]
MSIAIVTGAGGDIGRAICRSLAQQGHAIFATDINMETADITAREIVEAGGKAKAIRLDITDPQSVSSAISSAIAEGPVQVLVNNAGLCHAESLQSSSFEDWKADLDFNLHGSYLCFKAIEQHFISNRSGVVINIASVNGQGVYGHPGYSVAKAGLLHLTRQIAVEYGQFGIRANAIAPGTVKTAGWQARADKNPNVFEEAKRWYPLREVADPEDVAQGVAFLASDKAKAITGICLPIDCGLTAGQAEMAGTFSQSSDYQNLT